MRAKALSETMGRWVSEGSVMAASVATRIVGLCERPLVAPAISPVQEVVAQRRITRLFWQFGDDSWLRQPGPVSGVLRLSPSSFKTGHEARWSRTSVPKGVAWNRRPSPFGGRRRIVGYDIIAPRRRNIARLHRPRRASNHKKPYSW